MRRNNHVWLARQMLESTWQDREGRRWQVTHYDLVRPQRVRLVDLDDAECVRWTTPWYLMDQWEVVNA